MQLWRVGDLHCTANAADGEGCIELMQCIGCMRTLHVVWKLSSGKHGCGNSESKLQLEIHLIQPCNLFPHLHPSVETAPVMKLVVIL